MTKEVTDWLKLFSSGKVIVATRESVVHAIRNFDAIAAETKKQAEFELQYDDWYMLRKDV